MDYVLGSGFVSEQSMFPVCNYHPSVERLTRDALTFPCCLKSCKQSEVGPLCPQGSATMDSTNHGWKILEENNCIFFFPLFTKHSSKAPVYI
jgi:hypothetical protein